jgi:hypothetical protein
MVYFWHYNKLHEIPIECILKCYLLQNPMYCGWLWCAVRSNFANTLCITIENIIFPSTCHRQFPASFRTRLHNQHRRMTLQPRSALFQLSSPSANFLWILVNIEPQLAMPITRILCYWIIDTIHCSDQTGPWTWTIMSSIIVFNCIIMGT